MKLSVVIPVYNGEYTLRELNQKIIIALKNWCTFEIIYIYDNGKDDSWGIIEKLKQENPTKVKGYYLDKNYGQHDAILFGISRSTGDYIVTLDEDLQHDPVYIGELLRKQEENNYDVVYAVFKSASHSGLRNFTSDLLRKLLKRIVPGIYPDYSPYRLITREVGQSLTTLHNSYTFIDGYLGWLTSKFGTISAKHNKRKAGASSYSLSKLLKHAIMVTIAYSPLKKWLLALALLINVFSFVMYKILHTDTSFELFKPGFIIGLILLIIALVSEIIHYSRIKLISAPHAIRQI